MTIAIDIDGVFTNLEEFLKKEGRKFLQKEVVDETGSDIDSIFGVSKKEKDRFWEAKFLDYTESFPIRENASLVTHELSKKGHKILIITARRYEPRLGYSSQEEYEEMTKKTLTEKGVYYDEILFVKSPKVTECIENEVDIFIEDTPKNIEALSKVTNVITMDSSYNRHMTMPNVYHVSSWDEVLARVEDIKKRILN